LSTQANPDGCQSTAGGADGVLCERAVAVEELPASHAVGRLVGFQDEGEWAYVAGEYAGAYAPARASRVLRQCVLIRPDVLVIFDRVTAAASVEAVRWQTHLRGRLTLPAEDAGEWSVVGERAGVQVRTLLPDPRRVAGEAIGESTQRITVEPSRPAGSEQETLFLHVMTTGQTLPETRLHVADDAVELGLGQTTLRFFLGDRIGGEAEAPDRKVEFEHREANEIYGFEGPSII
jgi:hypothetical protein